MELATTQTIDTQNMSGYNDTHSHGHLMRTTWSMDVVPVMIGCSDLCLSGWS